MMPKKEQQVNYQITVTERQLKLINTALEEFFRIGLNQWGPLAERVANIGFEYPPQDAQNRDLVFDWHMGLFATKIALRLSYFLTTKAVF